MIAFSSIIILTPLLSASAFTVSSDAKPALPRTALQANFLESLFDSKSKATRSTPARDLMKLLVEENKCFSTKEGATSFGAACADDVVYEDRFEPEPFVGRIVSI